MKSTAKYSLLVIVAAIMVSSVFAQSTYHINTAENLNTSMLTSIIRDRNNNMWIGTYNGLFKHEGSRIRAFNHVGTDDKSISGGEMHTIIEDRQGFIWIGTTNGLDKINPVTYEIMHYPLRSRDSSSSFVGYIYSIFQDKEDYIWASTDAAMFRMDHKTGKYLAIPVTKDGKGMPSGLTSYKSGISTEHGLWMYTIEGMVYYEYATGIFFHRYHNPENNPVFNLAETGTGNQSDLRVDKKNNLWFISNHRKLIRYNTVTGKLDSFAFERPPNAWFCCYSIAIDHHDKVWIGFRHGGILVFDQLNKTFTPITYNSINSLVKSNYLYSLEEDYLGQMWVSTDNGLDIVNLYDTAVRQIFLSEEPGFLNLKYQMGTPTTDGTGYVYIPFYRFGFFRLTVNTGRIDSFMTGDGINRGATYILPVDSNHVYVARDRKLIAYALSKKTIASRAGELTLPDSIKNATGDIVWYHKYPSGLIIKKNSGRLYFVDQAGKLFETEGYGFKKNICLSSDSTAVWYINSDLNLVRRQLHTGNFETIDLQKMLRTAEFSFSNPREMIDDGESIWITSQNGVLRYQYNSEKLFPYTVKNGLAHSFTFSLAVDRFNRLWVGSLGGINMFDQKKNIFKTIISHPTVSYMDAFGSSVMLEDGTMYFFTGNKAFIIDPARVDSSATQQFQLKLQEMVINGKAYDWNNAELLSGLRYKQNRIVFRFGLLNFINQKNVRYYYYLEGLENEWNENINPGEVSFTSLPPGKYVFHLKCTDISDNMLAKELTIAFRIDPPFWQTWWFRALGIILVISVLYWFFKRRIRAIKTKAALNLQLSELEAKALRAQMNPHFIFNSLNAIQELIVTQNFTEAYQYLSSFSKLLRMVLNNSEKNFIPFSSELEMIQLYLQLESLRFKQSFQYDLEIDPAIDENTVLVPPLLLQPFIENAIWHGLMPKQSEKKLHISFHLRGDHLVYTVEDNGIGRKKAAAIKSAKIGATHFESKGITLSQHRIQILNQQLKENLSIKTEDLKDDEGEALGTRVTITIPRQQTFIK